MKKSAQFLNAKHQLGEKLACYTDKKEEADKLMLEDLGAIFEVADEIAKLLRIPTKYEEGAEAAEAYKEYLHEVADGAYYSQNRSLQELYAKVLEKLHTYLDYERILPFVTHYSFGLKKRDKIFYNQFTAMAEHTFLRATKTIGEKKYGELTDKDGRQIGFLKDIARFAWQKDYEMTGELYDLDKLKKYTQKQAYGPLAAQIVTASCHQYGKTNQYYYFKTKKENELRKACGEYLNKKENTAGSFMKYCMENGIPDHICFLSLGSYCKEHLRETFDIIDDFLLRPEYRLYALFLLTRVEYVDAKKLHSYIFNEEKKSQNAWQFFVDIMGGGDIVFEKMRQAMGELEYEKPLLEDSHITDLRRIGSKLLEEDLPKGLLQKNGKVRYDKFRMRLHIVAMALTLSETFEKQRDPVVLLKNMPEFFVCSDALVLTGGVPGSPVSLRSPEEYVEGLGMQLMADAEGEFQRLWF